MTQLHFWLRDEVKPAERRTPLMPEQAKQLMEAGHSVTVERSVGRCVKDEDYVAVGCKLAPTGSWITSPRDTIILGLKELPEDPKTLSHRHVYFAHCYKNQGGWKDILQRFISGEGSLYDLEFLNHPDGRRVAAFGVSAGFVGMAVGIMTWCNQQHEKDALLGQLIYHENYSALENYCSSLLERATSIAKRKPTIIIIGALGRCGNGALQLAEKLGLEVTKWDLEETKKGGPFPELLDHDIVVNCIFLSSPIPPFITKELITDRTRKMSVLVDVSCDTSNPHNPVPIYKECTTFFNPTLRVLQNTEGVLPVDVVSIDHLPSLVPLESSKEYATSLFPHLLTFPSTFPWENAARLFVEKTNSLRN